ncbi:16S rRNA (cytidine(1402)-2'-O)-methyltransferase [candidate division KSB1 bacterium]|nr:16S rRNA (cytidine(1402)-2'-O)-methyltransferase [candidate division KSB1 bacterium]
MQPLRTDQGELILVATPIGNLGDLSYRAVELLRGVDLLLCEDTRHSARLLGHYQIEIPTSSYGSHNLRSKLPWIIEQLNAGKRIGLVSDAGTPGISDPGTVLVDAAVRAGVRITAVPGASALVMALSLAGLPTDRFVFEGFLPHKKGRQTRLQTLADEPRTIVLYESPHRLVKTLRELLLRLGDRPAAVARELTKVYEEIRRGSLSDHLRHFERTEPRGEFVMVIAGTSYIRHPISTTEDEQNDA